MSKYSVVLLRHEDLGGEAYIDYIEGNSITEAISKARTEVFKADKVKALKELLGIKGEFTDEMDVIEEVLKCFPSRLTLNEFCNNVYMKEIGL